MATKLRWNFVDPTQECPGKEGNGHHDSLWWFDVKNGWFIDDKHDDSEKHGHSNWHHECFSGFMGVWMEWNGLMAYQQKSNSMDHRLK